jgi:dTDP-4-dehydrorhamnose 3,5-epimerase
VIFRETSVAGVFVIEIERMEDERGFFARTWCASEFAARGLNANVVQTSISFNLKRATLRGMHYQDVPYEEAKLVRALRGSIFDVAVDLRPQSQTYLQNVGVVLDAASRNMLYIPEGCAHGFETLEDRTEVEYHITESYAPEFARGVRWDDRAFRIAWPLAPAVVSERDRNYPDFKKETHYERSLL